jgi:hypothetical protein
VLFSSTSQAASLCKVVFNLARDDENKKRIAAAGGIDRVVQAKNNHPSCVANADWLLSRMNK